MKGNSFLKPKPTFRHTSLDPLIGRGDGGLLLVKTRKRRPDRGAPLEDGMGRSNEDRGVDKRGAARQKLGGGGVCAEKIAQIAMTWKKSVTFPFQERFS